MTLQVLHHFFTIYVNQKNLDPLEAEANPRILKKGEETPESPLSPMFIIIPILIIIAR